MKRIHLKTYEPFLNTLTLLIPAEHFSAHQSQMESDSDENYCDENFASSNE